MAKNKKNLFLNMIYECFGKSCCWI
jgi:hypothetical protein